MKILYKTNVNKYGNSCHVVIDHDNKTYQENTFCSDLTIIVKLKELRQLKELISNSGYKNIK